MGGEPYERATMGLGRLDGEVCRRSLRTFETERFDGRAYGPLEFCDNRPIRREPEIVAVRRSVSGDMVLHAPWDAARFACAKSASMKLSDRCDRQRTTTQVIGPLCEILILVPGTERS
jgi:hypothetical protein